MKLFSMTHPGGGCDPESDDYTVFRERPDSDDGWIDVREWAVSDGTETVFALCKATARCCGTGHIFLALSGDRQMLEDQASVLSQIHDAPLTDAGWDHREMALDAGEEWIAPDSHFVMEITVADRFEPYVYMPAPVEPDLPELGLSEDLFVFYEREADRD